MIAHLQPEIKLSVVDGSNSIGHFEAWVPAATSVAAGRAALAQLRSILPTTCAIVSGVVRYQVREMDPAAPAPGSDLRGYGVLVFATDTENQYAIIEIPGISADLIDPTEPTHLLLTAPALQSYINTLISGIFCNPFGYHLVECIAGLYELRR